jgi:hypothetical protein
LKVQNLSAFDDYYRIEVLGAGCLKGNNGIQSSGLGVAHGVVRPPLSFFFFFIFFFKRGWFNHPQWGGLATPVIFFFFFFFFFF